MPKKVEHLIITVEAGRSAEFPLDMLRYDRATPWTEADSRAIRNSVVDITSPNRKQISLVVTANGAPCVGRWESYGWKVTRVWMNDSAQWRGYNGDRVYR